MIDLTPVAKAVVTLAAALITVFLIPWLRRHTDARDREELLKWVEIAVTAAQQLHHQLSGAERKEYVRDFLNAKGYDISSREVDGAIEAAVLKLHQQLESA